MRRVKRYKGHKSKLAVRKLHCQCGEPVGLRRMGTNAECDLCHYARNSENCKRYYARRKAAGYRYVTLPGGKRAWRKEPPATAGKGGNA